MYSGQRVSRSRDYRYDEPEPAPRPRRPKRKKRRGPLPLLTASLLLGLFLGWTLRGFWQAQAAGTPNVPSASGTPADSSQGGSSSQPAGLKEPPLCPEWMTQDFLTVNPYSRPGTRLDAVNGVVVHYVGNPGTTAQQNHSYFQNLARTHETYASSHFLIGMDGEIIQNVPLDEVAYCSSQRNNDTISIECCHPSGDGAFTQATYESLVKLVRWLRDYYSFDTSQVIRHYDVTGKECPLYYVRNPKEWDAFLAALG